MDLIDANQDISDLIAKFQIRSPNRLLYKNLNRENAGYLLMEYLDFFHSKFGIFYKLQKYIEENSSNRLRVIPERLISLGKNVLDDTTTLKEANLELDNIYKLYGIVFRNEGFVIPAEYNYLFNQTERNFSEAESGFLDFLKLQSKTIKIKDD